MVGTSLKRALKGHDRKISPAWMPTYYHNSIDELQCGKLIDIDLQLRTVETPVVSGQ